MTWQAKDNSLIKEFEFASFGKAIDFVNKILPLTEEADHHPDIFIHDYKKVKIILSTHEENKVTQKDYSLAKKIDNII